MYICARWLFHAAEGRVVAVEAGIRERYKQDMDYEQDK